VDAANLLAGSAFIAAIRREEQALRLPALRGRVPDDLLGATTLGPVTRVYVTHLRFWALVAGVSIAVGVGLVAAGLRSNNPVIWSPGFVFALAGVVMTPWLVRSWGMVAVIYERGFALKKRTRRWTAKWDELTRLRLDVRRKPSASYATVQIFGTLGAVLDRRTFLSRLASAQADLERGQRDFGPIKLSRAGVTHKSHTIPWPELAGVSRVPYNALGATTTAIALVARDAAGGTETITVPEYRLWDSRVLRTILEEPPHW
jgi:hypothetical protein